MGSNILKINIVCVGNLKEKYWNNACDEYLKRLKKYHTVEIIEVEEEKLPKNYSDADIAKVKVKESLKIEKFCKGYVVVLDVLGNSISSEQFAKKLHSVAQDSFTITFVIGGSFGLSDLMKSKANYLLSFSKFTFPHQLMRVVLLEQIYRATTIINNITYHK